jgi:RNA polymerase sigma factor (sigma-70 family)
MRNIRFEDYIGPRLSREQQRKRVANVFADGLTECQRRVLIGYYLENKTIPELAEEYGVNKSTICRTLHRGEARMRLLLRY